MNVGNRSVTYGQTDRSTDSHGDRQTNRQTEKEVQYVDINISISCIKSLGCNCLHNVDDI